MKNCDEPGDAVMRLRGRKGRAQGVKDCLIIFAREPERGRVKTRLRGSLSEERCFKLYKAFLRDAIELTKPLKGINKMMAYDSASDKPEYLKRIARGFIFYKQIGKDLGRRMHNALRFAVKTDSGKIVIIGSDSPNLPLKYVKEAFRRLDRSDMVLGPSRDGGYYLLGLKKPCAGIFRGIKWSSGTVFEDTVKNAIRIKKKMAILAKWYDVDDPSGLGRLTKDLEKEKKSAPWTRKFLKI